MNLIELSLRRPVFAWVLMFSLIVFGAISLNRMGISQMPDVDFPVINISVSYEGAAPEVVEADLIDPLEQRLLAIEGIKEMRASASQGSGRITLEFDIKRNVDVVLQEVQTALGQFRLPPGVDPPTIRKQNPEEDPIQYISVYGDVPLKDMLVWTDQFLLDQLRFLPGVGEVSISGFSERNLRIWINPEKIAKYELTINDVVEALKAQHLESAAGQFTYGEKEIRVRWMGEANSVEEVGNIQILRRGGSQVYDTVIQIKDVAHIEDGLSDIRRLARVDGKQAVSISVKKQRGTNEVDVAESIRQKMLEIKDRFPKGYEYRINVDFTRSTKSTVHLTIEKLIVAAIITILVCFLFLGSLPAALNILFSIPTSIVGTFTILYFSGFTLNLFTLLALTLAISIVVDDAIMLLENIIRHYRMGKGSYKAALDGSVEILPAAIAATLAVIAVFLPVVFMEGVIGKFFFQFGITMSAAVMISLLEAVTITPMRAAAFLSSEPKVSNFEKKLDHYFEGLSHKYAGLLERTLQFKKTVVLASLLFFVLSLFFAKGVRQELVPAQDQDVIMVMGQTPPGSTLEITDEVAKKIEKIVSANKNVTGFFSSIGSGGADVNRIFMPLTLKPKNDRKETHADIMNELRIQFKEVKGVRITLRDMSARNLSTGRQNPLAINLRGPDLKILNEKAQEILKKLEDEKMAVDLDVDYREGVPELLITPNRALMYNKGVQVQAVGQVLSAAVGGLRQERYTADGRRYDIRFKIPADYIKSPKDIERLYIRNIAGNLIPLSQVVETREKPSSQSINRVNRQRAISLFGNLAPGKSQAVVLERAQKLAKEILPTGYSFALEGASAGFNESFGSLYTALLVGILVAYLILAIQFNSFIHPVSVLMSLPFSVSGALMSLWVFDVSLNLFSFIGLIVLMGIAKKNSILLVEFTTQVRNHKKEISSLKALTEACPVRLRPILMTSVATVAAALPLVVGTDMGSEARLAMGLVIIGGTIVSTVLTLFVVPSFYLWLDGLSSKKKVSY